VIERAAPGDNRASAAASRRRRRRHERKRGRRFHRPRLWSRPGSFDPGRFQIGSPSEQALNVPRSRSRRSKLRQDLSQFPRPKAKVPPDSGESGFGVRFPLGLALLPRLPYQSFLDLDPEGPPPSPHWQRSEAFARFQAATPDREARPWQPLPIRGKRIPPVDNEDNGDKSAAAGTGRGPPVRPPAGPPSGPAAGRDGGRRGRRGACAPAAR
jgi:hypothetical protein